MEDRVRAEGAPVSHPQGEDLARLLARLLASQDRDTIWTLTTGFFRSLGFADVIYGYSPDSRGAELGSPDDFLLISTLPRPVLDELVQRGHYWQSMTFRWALQNTGIAPWSRGPVDCGLPADFTYSPEALMFFDRVGLRTGACIGVFAERARGRAVVALVGPPDSSQETIDALVAAHHDALFTVAAVMHQRLSSLPLRLERRSLTPRQREVLEWVAHGKTAADIALIMGISAPTVEKHLRLARETLGVETTAHAVVKAAALNEVFTTLPTDPRPR